MDQIGQARSWVGSIERLLANARWIKDCLQNLRLDTILVISNSGGQDELRKKTQRVLGIQTQDILISICPAVERVGTSRSGQCASEIISLHVSPKHQIILMSEKWSDLCQLYCTAL